MPQVVGQNESTAFYSLQLLHILNSDKILQQGKATDLSDLWDSAEQMCIIFAPYQGIIHHSPRNCGKAIRDNAPLQPEWGQSHQRARRGLAFTTKAVDMDGQIVG